MFLFYFYHTPSDAFQNYDTRSVNTLMMPPRPGTVMILPPPQNPPNQQNSDGASAIDVHSGDVGQYLGTFGPSFQHI